MSGNFYKFSKTDGFFDIKRTTPLHDKLNDDEFLVFAKTEDRAFSIAIKHIYEDFPATVFKGEYEGVYYDGIECVI